MLMGSATSVIASIVHIKEDIKKVSLGLALKGFQRVTLT